MKISLGKFILILEFHKWILVCGYEVKEILAHISVQIRWKVLLLSAGNIQAEIFNRLSRSIRQELTKNAVQKEWKTSIWVFSLICMISKSPDFSSFD